MILYLSIDFLSTHLLQLSDFFIHHDFSESWSSAGDSGDQIGDGFDALDLLFQEPFEEVGHVAVFFDAGQRVEVDDRLVDGLFQLQSGLHRVQRGSPFIVFRSWNVLQDNATTARVLVEEWGRRCKKEKKKTKKKKKKKRKLRR